MAPATLAAEPSEAPAAGRCVFLALPRRPQPGRPDLLPADPGKLSMVLPCYGRVRVRKTTCSVLTYHFNRLWCEALNARARDGVTHFAMLHDDITPSPLWADTLIAEMDAHGADVMSAVVPIKDARGLTTTGVRDTERPHNRRLTLREVYALPETFGIDDIPHGRDEILIVNTGCWVCRFTERWVEPPVFPGFLQRDGVVARGDGTFAAATLSEDWCFSEWAAAKRLKVMATRKVALGHVGDDGAEYRNDSAWGEWETDRGDDQ